MHPCKKGIADFERSRRQRTRADPKSEQREREHCSYQLSLSLCTKRTVVGCLRS